MRGDGTRTTHLVDMLPDHLPPPIRVAYFTDAQGLLYYDAGERHYYGLSEHAFIKERWDSHGPAARLLCPSVETCSERC